MAWMVMVAVPGTADTVHPDDTVVATRVEAFLERDSKPPYPVPGVPDAAAKLRPGLRFTAAFGGVPSHTI